MALKTENIHCENCNCHGKSLFSGLCSEHLDSLSYAKDCVVYKKGQTIFHEGTRPLGLFCIKGGKIKVFKTGSQGKEQIIYFAKPGDFLGYRSMLGEEYYSVSAEVLEEAKVCFIPKQTFLEVLYSDSRFGDRLMRSLCSQLGLMEERVTTLAQKSVRERLAATLLMLKETYGMEEENESHVIDLALSREDLANIVGTATETVIRLISEFKKEGIINNVGKKIRITDVPALARTADFYSGVRV